MALICYSLAILTEQKKHRISDFVLTFLTLGITLDITATILMIAGSSNTPFTLHGILGYSSLTAMLLDTALIWRYRIRAGAIAIVPKRLHLYSRFAYIWWILAFLTGGTLVLFK